MATEPSLQPVREPARRLTAGQRGCLTGCFIVALLSAVAMVAVGWWVRETMRRDPQASARLLFPGAPETPVRVEPGGLTRRLDVDMLLVGSVAWSPDGRHVALCGMPGMSFRRFLQPPQRVAPWDIPKAQEGQRRRIQQMMAGRVYLLDVSTNTSRTVRSPEAGAEAERIAWWPDGRLLMFTGPPYFTMDETPRDDYGPRRLWLVNPTDNRAEQVAELKGAPFLSPGDRGVAFTMSLGTGKRQAYVLLPTASGPVLRELPAAGGSVFTWDSRGNLYCWRSPPEGQRWAVVRVVLPEGKTIPVQVSEREGRSVASVSADERVMTRAYPADGKTQALFAVNPATGVARRLSEALPPGLGVLRARLLQGRWLLVEHMRHSNSGTRYRLYGYHLAQGRFYPVTDWGTMSMLHAPQSSSPAGDVVLLEQMIRPENVLRMFTGSFAAELWLLRLNERQLLAQPPVGPEAWGGELDGGDPTKEQP